MANDRNRTDEQYSGPTDERRSDNEEERTRSGAGDDDVRGIAEEGDEEFEDMDDEVDEEEENDGAF